MIPMTPIPAADESFSPGREREYIGQQSWLMGSCCAEAGTGTLRSSRAVLPDKQAPGIAPGSLFVRLSFLSADLEAADHGFELFNDRLEVLCRVIDPLPLFGQSPGDFTYLADITGYLA